MPPTLGSRSLPNSPSRRQTASLVCSPAFAVTSTEWGITEPAQGVQPTACCLQCQWTSGRRNWPLLWLTISSRMLGVSNGTRPRRQMTDFWALLSGRAGRFRMGGLP